MAEQDGHRLITSDLNQTFIIKDYPDPGEYSFSDDSLLHTGNSTRSLLTPLYASDYESPESFTNDQLQSDQETSCVNGEDWKQNEAKSYLVTAPKQRKTTSKSKQAWSTIHPVKGKTPEKAKRLKCVRDGDNRERGSPSWEEWLVKKAIDDMKKIKIEKEEEKTKKKEIERKENEKKLKMSLAEEKRKEWLEMKYFELGKERKAKAAQKQYEKLKAQQIKEISEIKSTERYAQWLEDKKIKEQEAKEKRKQEMLKAREEQIKRKAQNEVAFEKWLEDAKVRLKNNGNRSSDCTDNYNDRISGPSPGYVNPVPWIGPKRKTAYFGDKSWKLMDLVQL